MQKKYSKKEKLTFSSRRRGKQYKESVAVSNRKEIKLATRILFILLMEKPSSSISPCVFTQYAETCQIKSSSLTWTWSRKGNPFRLTSGSFKVFRDKQTTCVASITTFRFKLTRFPLVSDSALNCFCWFIVLLPVRDSTDAGFCFVQLHKPSFPYCSKN